jgi:hypothetical protein
MNQNMTQEDKKLLHKDLYARLPYRVKCEVIKRDIDGEMLFIRNGPAALDLTVDNVKELITNNMYEIKPYLLPQSSMTAEQKKEWLSLMIPDSYGILYHTIESFDYLYKNHIDIRGLIEKGLAIDATGLNIY